MITDQEPDPEHTDHPEPEETEPEVIPRGPPVTVREGVALGEYVEYIKKMN
jgi:hypothetical protein